MENNVLRRSGTNTVIAGVCGGIGEYFEIDPTVIRIIFVVLVLASGSGIFVYLLLWLLIPGPVSTASNAEATIREGLHEMEAKADEITEKVNQSLHQDNTTKQEQPQQTATRPTTISGHEPQFWLGVILIVVGAWFFLDNFGFFRFIRINELWPVVLIVIGFFYLVKRD